MPTGRNHRRTTRPPSAPAGAGATLAIPPRRVRPPIQTRIRGTAGTREDWLQIVPFCVIGGVGAVVNLAAYAGLIRVAGVPPLVAASAAFCIAVTHNYLANRWVTFRRMRAGFMAQASRFAVVSTLGLGVNLVLLTLLLAVMDSIPAQAVAICLVTPVNFLGNKLWAFAGAGS